MDYAAWAQRASRFLRGLTHLPGEIELDDEIEPPGTDDRTQDWLRSEECSLPAELKAFVAASRSCCFHYRWRPPQPLQARIGMLFPGCEELTGGADLCEAARFQNHDNRSWFRDEFPSMFQQTFQEVAALVSHLLPSEARAQWPSSTNDMLKSMTTGITDSEREHGRVTILPLPGGDRISLVADEREIPRPVVYVRSSAPDQIQIISASFEQFLSDWEQLCYITPSLENLRPWLNAASGQLDPHRETAAQLRELLTTTIAEEGGSL